MTIITTEIDRAKNAFAVHSIDKSGESTTLAPVSNDELARICHHSNTVREGFSTCSVEACLAPFICKNFPYTRGTLQNLIANSCVPLVVIWFTDCVIKNC